MLKLFNSDKVECASCAPVKMRPLSMLMNDNGDVVMKHHEDMIVEECGCHWGTAKTYVTSIEKMQSKQWL